jgi:TolA-binding protein
MEFNEDYVQLFDAFTMGNLNETAQKDFQNRLTADEDFSNQFQQYQALVEGLNTYNENIVKKRIQSTAEKLQKEQFFSSSKIITMNTEKKSPIRWLAAAAVLLIALGTYYFLQPKEVDTTELLAASSDDKLSTKSDDIAAKIIERLEAPGMATSTKTKDDSLKLALDLYKNDKYEDARITLSQYLERYPDDDVAVTYLGLSLFQQAQYSKAAIHFNKLILKKDFEYVNMAKWYLALCDMRFKDKNSVLQAKSLLEDLYKNGDSGYTKEAKMWLDTYFKGK